MPLFSSSKTTGASSLDKGNALYAKGHYHEAEKEFRRSLKLWTDVVGHDHEETLKSEQALAYSLHKQKKYKEAESYYRKAVSGRHRVLGREHQDTLNSKQWLAHSLFKQEEFKEAETYFREVALAQGTILGQNHEDSLNPRHWLAQSLYRQAKFAEAEIYFRQVVVGKEKALGPDHTSTFHNQHRLAQTLYRQEKFKEAEDNFRALMLKRTTVLGELHDDTLDAKHWLAQSLYQQEKYDEAEVYFRETASGRRKVLGHDHKHTLNSQNWLAQTIEKQEEDEAIQKPVKAPSLERDKVAQRDKTLDQDGENTLVNQKSPVLPQAQQHVVVTPDSSQDRNDNSNDSPASSGTSVNSHPQPKALPRTPTPTPRATPTPTPTTTSPSNDGVQELTQHLDKFFIDERSGTSTYNDSDIRDISRLLARQHPQWSRAPRTYVVLRTINCLHLLNDFIASGFTDYWFPVTATNLPAILRSDQRLDFVDAQRLVLTKSLDLEKGTEGQHCYFHQDGGLPLERQRILGRGGFGQVDEVLSLISYQKYARKRVLRKTILRGRNPEHLQYFITEIEILKRLQHKHVVQFVGSYSDTKYLGLLMRPVAEMDLSVYLTRPDISSRLGELRTFFGCLAAALDFLHARSVRHKDIKPKNILIDRGNVLFTDFGLSYDFSDDKVSTTVSMVNGLTPRYCAPEVAQYEPRNKSSDIWSLGVVYLEMLVTLKGLTFENMQQYFAEHGTKEPWVRINREGFIEFLDHLKTVGDRGDNGVTNWIGDMLQDNPVKRPHASLLLATINAPSKNEYENKGFCGICCLPEGDDDDFSDFSD